MNRSKLAVNKLISPLRQQQQQQQSLVVYLYDGMAAIGVRAGRVASIVSFLCHWHQKVFESEYFAQIVHRHEKCNLGSFTRTVAMVCQTVWSIDAPVDQHLPAKQVYSCFTYEDKIAIYLNERVHTQAGNERVVRISPIGKPHRCPVKSWEMAGIWADTGRQLFLQPLYGDAIFRRDRSRRVDSNSAPHGNTFEWKEEADDVVMYGASLHSTLTLWKRRRKKMMPARVSNEK